MVVLGTYQAALYKAETVLERQARRFANVNDVRTYVNDLVNSEWFFDLWPKLEVVTVHRRGTGATWSCAAHHASGAGEVFLASLDHATVLHEVAHLCTLDDGHGVHFAEALLALVRHEMGFFAWTDLLYALRATEPFQYVREGTAKRTCSF